MTHCARGKMQPPCRLSRLHEGAETGINAVGTRRCRLKTKAVAPPARATDSPAPVVPQCWRAVAGVGEQRDCSEASFCHKAKALWFIVFDCRSCRCLSVFHASFRANRSRGGSDSGGNCRTMPTAVPAQQRSSAMRLTAVRTIGVCLSLYVATALGGCYESLEPEPQAQQPSAPAETGPITSLTT